MLIEKISPRSNDLGAGMPRTESFGSGVPQDRENVKKIKIDKLDDSVGEMRCSPKSSNEAEMETQLDPCEQDFENY